MVHSIRMPHWQLQMVDGAEFWISCKWLLRKASQWELIKCPAPSTRALTSILTKYQYTYQVSVYWYLYLVFKFPNTDTDTSYFKNILEYWYFQYFSVSLFLKNKDKTIIWYMIIPKIKSNFTPLLMAVIIGHFQICNSILLGSFNWSFMIMAMVIRNKFD